MTVGLTLYHAPPSTCSQKVRLALAEKRLVYQSQLIDLFAGGQHDPDYVKLNPNHVVPTLVHDLGIRCFLNGDERQSSNTRHLIFNLWEQIAELSQAMTLEPGDVIFSGTPGGVGMAMKPMTM